MTRDFGFRFHENAVRDAWVPRVSVIRPVLHDTQVVMTRDSIQLSVWVDPDWQVDWRFSQQLDTLRVDDPDYLARIIDEAYEDLVRYLA